MQYNRIPNYKERVSVIGWAGLMAGLGKKCTGNGWAGISWFLSPAFH